MLIYSFLPSALCEAVVRANLVDFLIQSPTATPAPFAKAVTTVLSLPDLIAIWLVFNVVLALLPLAVTPLFRSFTAGGFQVDRRLLRDGELFFFSSSLSAASIGKTFELFLKGEPATNIFVLLVLLLTLVFSAICFGGAVSAKINRENGLAIQSAGASAASAGAGAAGLTDGEKNTANISLVVAVVAALFSFVASYQGGFK